MSKGIVEKKKKQLGMNPSTASGRLVKDILWSFIVDTEREKCFHCGEPMTRETFSIEHKIPWLDSEDPIGLFFDLDNISFSHHSCNCAAAARQNMELKKSDEYREFVSKQFRKESPPGMNWCNICKRHLPVENFGKHRRRWNGLRNECKECRRK